MKDATIYGRSAKREIIVIDDDSACGQPPVKRGAEAFLCAKVDELEKEVDKWKDKYQRAVRAAGQYKERAETAETKLDSKFAFKEVFNAEKIRANALQKRLTEVSSHLEEARRKAESTANIERENEALKTEMAETRKSLHDSQMKGQARIDKLKTKRAEERQRARDSKAKDRARIKLLKQKLAEQKVKSPLTDGSRKLHEIGHPTNILQLCSPDSSESTSFNVARMKLIDVCGALDRATVAKSFSRLTQREWVERCLETTAHCEACDKAGNMATVISHFVSKGHQKEVSALGAAVSSAALKYWMDKLKPESELAAAAASSRREEEKKPEGGGEKKDKMMKNMKRRRDQVNGGDSDDRLAAYGSNAKKFKGKNTVTKEE